MVEDTEQVTVVQEDAPSDETTASTEAGTGIKEPAEEKKNIPWCILLPVGNISFHD